ncbi:MAG TPA: c-type cytochrome, partial [Thermodesulfobacteriota bacterium]|nr:c-type cytochrome [Thermodesulfobacteriota bacterium]
MKRFCILIFFACLFFVNSFVLRDHTAAAQKKAEYLLPGDIKEGWRVFVQKKCGQCHSIWGEGGKGGPDLGAL